MRYPSGHKNRSRQQILDSAARVFRERGYAGGGVGEVMQGAGMTKGGFYAHFRSKESLLAAALEQAFETGYQQLTGGLGDQHGSAWTAGVISRYLSIEHFDQPLGGCPVPALLSEVHRAGAEPRKTFETHMLELANRLSQGLAGETTEHRLDQGLAVLALLVGGMSMARATNDRALAERLLAACRAFALSAVPPSDEGSHDSPATEDSDRN